MHTVKIFNETDKVLPIKVLLDGEPVRCRGIDYHAAVDSIPTVTLELSTLADIDISHVAVRYHKDTIAEAVQILQRELIGDTDLRAAFIASIKSALDEAKPYTKPADLAEAILDRVTGRIQPDLGTDSMVPGDNPMAQDAAGKENV